MITQMPRFSPSLLLLAAFLFLPGLNFAQSDPALRRQLESVYSDWQSAMLARDYAGYTRVTAGNRQAATRNIIVSQKKPFPKALFEMPMDPPPLHQLRLLKAEEENDTAIAVYYGKVDFDVLDKDIPENIFVLSFFKEEGQWKFDRTRFIDLGPGPEIRDRIARGELEFLAEPEFEPIGEVLPTPATFSAPDFAAYVEVTSIGYETRVRINTAHDRFVAQDVSTDLLIGGLAEGKNSIRIDTKPLDVPGEKQFKVEVFVIRERERKPPARIFQFAPETVPATHEAPLWANAVTIRD